MKRTLLPLLLLLYRVLVHSNKGSLHYVKSHCEPACK